MDVVSIATETHGRVLIEASSAASSAQAAGLLVAFHGYGQAAEDMLAEVVRIPGADRWRIVSVQALHRFYARRDERVVASWMTRQDRDLAIEDNRAYVDRVIASLGAAPGTCPIVFVGFSQGASMAYRAGLDGGYPAAGVIALGGDLPPELKSGGRRPCPPVLIGAGTDDPWYTPERCDADEQALRSIGALVEVHRFHGAHEWTEDFRAAAGAWLVRVLA